MSGRTYTTILSREEVQEAREYDRIVNEKVKSFPNYCGIYIKDRYFVGKCGEIALAHYARDYSLSFEDTTNDRGVSDLQDGIFILSGTTVNIKNSHHPRAKMLMQPVKQSERHSQDFLIGASGKMLGGCIEVTLWGVVPDDAFREYGKINTNYYAPAITWQLGELPIGMDVFARMMEVQGQC